MPRSVLLTLGSRHIQALRHMDYDNPQFIAAVKKVVQSQKIAHEQEQSSEEDPKGPRQSIHAELTTQVPLVVHTKSADKLNNWQKAKTAMEIIGIAAAILYAYIAVRQWREMISARHQNQPSVEAATRSAAAAENAIKNQQKAFAVEQRPYLVGETPAFAGPPAPGIDIFVNFKHKNIGHTPALNTFTHVRVSPLRVPRRDKVAIGIAWSKFLASEMREVRAAERDYRDKMSKTPEGGENDMAPTEENFTSNVKPVILSADEFTEVTKLDPYLFLVLVGLSTYTDASGGHYETEYCWFWAGPNPMIWHKCASYGAIR